RGGTPCRPTEPIAAGADARTSAANSPSPGVRPPSPSGEELPHPEPRPVGARGARGEGGLMRIDADRNTPDSAAGLSSSGLAGRDGDRYHRELARLGAQVADALAHAHKNGVLHRDIKPSNLLHDAAGNVWVTDFGLAKFEEGEDLSRSQDVVGTLRYMAPERFRGVSDRRCDLYALGATLYELLTLRPAFESHDRLRLIDQIVHEPPASPRQLDPPSPATWRRSCRRRWPRTRRTGSPRPTNWEPSCGGSWRTGRSARAPSRPTNGSGGGASATPTRRRPCLRPSWPSARPSRPGPTMGRGTRFGTKRA